MSQRPESLLLPLFYSVDQLIDLRRRQVLDELVVQHHCRSPRAGADALDLLQMEQPVLCRFLMIDAQLFLAMLKNLVAAAQQAAHVGADLEVVLTNRAR